MSVIEISAKLGLLARIASEKNSSQTKYQLELFDRSGHVFSGVLHQYDETKDMLILSDNRDKLSFIRLSEIIHFSISNASKHTEILQNQRSNDHVSPMCSINIIDQLELLEDRLSTNYGVTISFQLSDSTHNHIQSNNLSSLIATIETNFSDLAKEDFARIELKKISQVVIHHRQGDRLRFKMDDSVLSISLDLSESLGFNLSAQVEKGINKIL